MNERVFNGTELVPGDRVIWRRYSDEWTVDQVRDDPAHPKPVVLVQRMFGEGPLAIGNAHPSELIRLSRASQTSL